MKKLRNTILVSTLSILAACSNSGNPFGGGSNDTFFGNNMLSNVGHMIKKIFIINFLTD